MEIDSQCHGEEATGLVVGLPWVRSSNHTVWLIALSLLCLVASYTLVMVVFLTPRVAVENFDYQPLVSIGYRLNWTDFRTLVDGFYPLGYSFLLRVAIEHGIDATRIGQFLSAAGGLLALVSVFGITYHLTRRPLLALAASAMLFTNAIFLRFAPAEGNDMPAAGLQLLGLYLILVIPSSKYSSAQNPLAFAAGLALGLAYLVRYTSLMLLPCMLLYLLWKAGKPYKQSMVAIGLLLCGFLLAASVQVVPSAIVYHQPFYNLQAKNVWFGIYGQGDWVKNWSKQPDTISLLEVIALDPLGFLNHWWEQFSSIFDALRLWPAILHFSWLVGSLAIVVDRRLHPANRALFVLAMLFPAAVTSMAWVGTRFLLTLLAVQALAIVILVDRVASLIPCRRALQTALAAAILIGATLFWQGVETLAWLGSPVRTEPAQMNEFLRVAGMKEPTEVATNDGYLQATDIPERTPYYQAYSALANPKTVDELLSQPAAARWRYLVLNYSGRFGTYGDYYGMGQTAVQAKSQLVPLKLDEFVDVFLVRRMALGEESAKDFVRDERVLDNGMNLVGHKLVQWKGNSSLYLHWTTLQQLDRSYKVSIRTQSAAGNVLFQVDAVPQLWTYPTDQWVPGDTVVDFYYLGSGLTCPDNCQLAVVVYDEQSGKPALWQSSPGDQQRESILLQQFSK